MVFLSSLFLKETLAEREGPAELISNESVMAAEVEKQRVHYP